MKVLGTASGASWLQVEVVERLGREHQVRPPIELFQGGVANADLLRGGKRPEAEAEQPQE